MGVHRPVFPLTPALSLRERENNGAASAGAAAVRTRTAPEAAQRGATSLPLPEGEGRGEGKQSSGSMRVQKVDCVSVHCALDTVRPMRYERLMRHCLLSLGLCLAPALLFAAEAPATFKVSEFTFTRPPAWEWVESASPMRKAQLKVNSDDKKSSAEVVFFHFGQGQGGDTK